MTLIINSVFFACDHAGIDYKNMLISFSQENFPSLQIDDLGAYSEESVDYPDYACALADKIKDMPQALGILICGSGVGISIAANRFPFIRAALCTDGLTARLSRQHNDANVLCMGSRLIGIDSAKDCLRSFLTTPFEGGRHQKRVDKLAQCLSLDHKK